MAIKSIKDPEPVTIVNAGPNVNSAYTEFAPYPLGDTALLYATIPHNQVLEYDKKTKPDFYARFKVAHKQYHVDQVDSFQWALDFNDGKFNVPNAHVGNGCYSPGGDRFYFTKCSEGDSMIITCKIYYSKFDKNKMGTL